MQTNDDSMTVKLPRDLMRWIRVRAAEAEVSISEYVRHVFAAERERATKKGSRG